MRSTSLSAMVRGSFARVAGFFGFWLILSCYSPSDLPVGVPAAAAATWVSLRLFPPGQWTLRPASLAGLVLRFLRQSIVAGIDVAWRALDPRLPLRPGFIVYPTNLPPGEMRNVFCTMTSLLPGTLPSGPDSSLGIAIHCLDIEQEVNAQLAVEEALFVQAFGIARNND
ncbi:MAG: Na+/H+ antiporter subunit E [Beijerinckiaceae bacterium]|nr:Na+/H+ antiporter subunit E [Beijerinckiaceae bacterium]